MAQEYTGWDESDEWDAMEKKQKKAASDKKARETTDFRSEEGITVGLIDSIIVLSRVVNQRLKVLQLTPAVQEALKDLKFDNDLLNIIKP